MLLVTTKTGMQFIGSTKKKLSFKEMKLMLIRFLSKGMMYMFLEVLQMVRVIGKMVLK